MSTDLFQRLKASNRLPSPPGVALRILDLSRSDDTSLDDLAKTISTDPALARPGLVVWVTEERPPTRRMLAPGRTASLPAGGGKARRRDNRRQV